MKTEEFENLKYLCGYASIIFFGLAAIMVIGYYYFEFKQYEN